MLTIERSIMDYYSEIRNKLIDCKKIGIKVEKVIFNN